MQQKKQISKLDLLLEKKKQLEAQIIKEKNRTISEERKVDTRQKILLGAYLKEKYKGKESELAKLLDPFLTKPQDRALFGLPEKKND